MEKRTEHDELVDRVMKKFEARSNFNSYNEDTTIGKIYSQLCKNTELSVADVDRAIEEIENIFHMCGISLEQLEIIAGRTLTNRTLSSGIPNWDYLKLLLKSKANQGINVYITNHCNQIPDLLEYVSYSEHLCNEISIKVCDDEWFETHVKFIKKIINRLETRRSSIQHKEDNLEALKLKKEQINIKANEKFECECGGCYSRAHKSQHEKTSTHIKWIQQGKPVRNNSNNEVMCVEITPTDMMSINEVIDQEEENIDKDNEDETQNPIVNSVKKNTKEYLSTIINCECGQSHSRANTSNHRKTNRHQSWEKNKTQEKKQHIKTDDNTVITCGCGGTYTRTNKTKHEKTAKHIKSITN